MNSDRGPIFLKLKNRPAQPFRLGTASLPSGVRPTTRWLRLLIGAGCLGLFLGAVGCRDPSPPVQSPIRVDDPATAEESSRDPGRLVAFGNSLTAGLGVPMQESYPARLEHRLLQAGYPFRVINAGVSGETTSGGIRRVDLILRLEPEIVILELGANDGLRGLALGRIEENLEAIVRRLREGGVRVILAGMRIPPNYGEAYTRGFEGIYPRLAARYRLPLIPFFLEGVAAREGLNQGDGIHPTGSGYAVVVENLWPVLEPVVREAVSARGTASRK